MKRKHKRMLVRIILSALCTAALLAFAPDGWLGLALWLAVYLLIGYDILYKAACGIFSGQLFDENFLMSVATVGAIVLAVWGRGEYLEAVAVMLFYQVGELFQALAVNKSRRSIGALMNIRPDYANVLRNGESVRLSPDEVAVGETIAVAAGERIPLDGVIIEGCTNIDTSALTGESIPRSAEVGDSVLGGCINIDGFVKIRTIKKANETTVAKILELVENASSRKSVSEKFISKFAKIYTPAVCAVALLLGVLPPLALLMLGVAPEWGEWIYRALTFLVISCPCALVVSIPLTFFACLGGASRTGILIKGASFVETLSRLDCIAFDKTGTLTEGYFAVSGIYPSDGVEKNELLRYAAYAESTSSHPIARSLAEAYGNAVDEKCVSEIHERSGRGVEALIDDVRVLVGNARLLREENVEFTALYEAVGSIIYVSADGRFLGCITVSDKPKHTAFTAVESLKSLGVKRVVMLTGDTEASAKEVAEKIGIDEVYAELLPDRKVENFEAVIRLSRACAFVGDGINDAPVLSRADVGIAMGGIGSDAAIEAADVVIMDDRIEKVPLAVKLAKRCMRIVYQNILLSMGIKFLCLALVALGFAGMWLAIFADVGVMVLAVLNAIRALMVKK